MRQKGDRRERQLVNCLAGRDMAVMRAPSSGSAAKRNLPDLIAGDGHGVYVIEAKSSSGDPIRIGGEKVAGLMSVAKKFMANPLIGARFDEEHGDPSYGEDWDGWYFMHPSMCHVTDGGNYRIKKEIAIETAIKLKDFPPLRS